MEKFPIKIYFNNEVRRINIDHDISYQKLVQTCTKILGLKEMDVILKYMDDEGDYVSFSSDEELHYSLHFLFNTNNFIFRIHVYIKQDQSSLNNISQIQIQSNVASDSGFEPRSSENFGNKRFYKERKEIRQKRKKLLDCRFVGHISVEDGSKLFPNIQFVKKWKLRNTGTINWPVDTKLVRVSYANEFSAPLSVHVGICEPEKEIEVSVPMTTPNANGLYESYWKLSVTSGKKFGQRLRCQVLVSL